METELGALENEWERYIRWCRGQGLYPEFDELFFDWMNDAE